MRGRRKGNKESQHKDILRIFSALVVNKAINTIFSVLQHFCSEVFFLESFLLMETIDPRLFFKY